MWKLTRRILTRFYRPVLSLYLQKDRVHRYRGLNLVIKQGVFHPHFFYSTKYLLSYVIQHHQVKGKNVLELGAGSGLISFTLAQQGAHVTATDINETAIAGLLLNKEQLQSDVRIILSDLFEHIPKSPFDLILINPPYYPKNPQTPAEHAWYCGENHTYFRKLFKQLADHVSTTTQVLMVMSEDCDLSEIRHIAAEHHFLIKQVHAKRITGEFNYIYHVKLEQRGQ